MFAAVDRKCRKKWPHPVCLLCQSQLFSQSSFDFFITTSLGICSNDIKSQYQRKSVSTERTFREISRPAELHAKCNELCESLASDVKRLGVVRCTVAGAS